MGFFDILLISVGLSMDNMAVAAASSCGSKNYPLKVSIKVALSFCLTGIICMLLGWFGGTYLEKYISAWDHWVSFFILIYIGGKMVLNFIKAEQVSASTYNLLKTKTLIMLALATNIDVFAIGLTVAFYNPSLPLVLAVLSICIVIFTLFGFFMGRKMGAIFGKKAELIGGVILIVIAIKILLEGVFNV